MPKSRVVDLLAHQARELDRLDDTESRAFLALLEDARRELREKLDAMVATGADAATPATAQHIRVMLAQAESAIFRLRHRLAVQLDQSTELARKKSLAHLLATLAKHEPDFIDTGNAVEHAVLRRIAADQGLQLHKYSVDRYSADLIDAVQRQIKLGLVQGQTISQIRDRLTAIEGSPFAALRGRAETIVRTELNTAYNESHTAGIIEAAAELDRPGDPDPLLKRASEFRDLRNHPMSRALDGRTAAPADPFRVPIADVKAQLDALNAQRRAKKLPPRRMGGILWPVDGADYVGVYPAHYNDRGRVVPFRASWSAD